MAKVSAQCSCGKTVKADARHAGRKGKCPSCGAILIVPGHANAPVPPTGETDGNRYYNREWNFSVVFPAEWELL